VRRSDGSSVGAGAAIAMEGGALGSCAGGTCDSATTGTSGETTTVEGRADAGCEELVWTSSARCRVHISISSRSRSAEEATCGTSRLFRTACIQGENAASKEAYEAYEDRSHMINIKRGMRHTKNQGEVQAPERQ